MSEHEIPRLKDALAAGVPAGILATVRLPTLFCTTGATMHSPERGTTCGELRAWGGLNGSTVKHVTVTGALHAQYVNDHPTLTVCTDCVGEEVDRVDEIADLVHRVHHLVFRTWKPRMAILDDHVAAGRHRVPNSYVVRREPWVLLGELRQALDPTANADGHIPLVDVTLRRFETSEDQVLLDWFAAAVADLRARLSAHVEQMRADQTAEDVADVTVDATVRYLMVASPEKGWTWTNTAAAVARYVNHAEPVAWLRPETGRPQLPVVVAPYNEIAHATGAHYLGRVDHVDRTELAQRLRVTERLLNEGGTALEDLATALEVAAGVTARA